MKNKLNNIIQPPDYLGMLGGGQLGRFFAISAQKMGYSVLVLDPDKKSPAGKIADKHLCKTYDDLGALDELKLTCKVVTTEFENIPYETLKYLEKDIDVRPGSKAVSIVQNRIREKNFLRDCGCPVGQFIVIDSFASIKNINEQDNIFPAILKTAQFGYDGKGQIHVKSKIELEDAFKDFNNTPCILEEKLDLDLEVSLVLSRTSKGNFEIYPLIENQHVSGILDLSIIPARIHSSVKEQATILAKKISNKLDYVGVMAVEFFVSKDILYVNEIAPRPHNSGHFSIDTCTYNQFDQQVLILAGRELEKPAIKFPIAVMLNLLGDLWFRSDKQKEPRFELIAGEGISLHLYGKEEPRVGRKMGHVTILGLKNQSQKDVIKKAESIRKILWEN